MRRGGVRGAGRRREEAEEGRGRRLAAAWASGQGARGARPGRGRRGKEMGGMRQEREGRAGTRVDEDWVGMRRRYNRKDIGVGGRKVSCDDREDEEGQRNGA